MLISGEAKVFNGLVVGGVCLIDGVVEWLDIQSSRALLIWMYF